MAHQRFDLTGPGGTEFSVLFRPNPRAKRLILRIDPKTGGPVVIAPSTRHAKAAEKFVKAKAEWLETQLKKQSTQHEIVPGTRIPIEGVPHLLTRSSASGRTKQLVGEEAVLDSPGQEITFGDRIERYLKILARKRISERVDVHAERLRVDPRRISIRDTRSRWGSCSAKGNLNFSWRLILAPPEVLDYVVAHEVAHLLEMNHSPAFWARVEESFGPCKRERDWLKRHGRALHSVGSGGSTGG